MAALVLRRPANFAWYTGGADSRVDRLVAEGLADLIVRRDRALVLIDAGPEIAAGVAAPTGAVA
jgi:hypothetical protein